MLISRYLLHADKRSSLDTSERSSVLRKSLTFFVGLHSSHETQPCKALRTGFIPILQMRKQTQREAQ